MFKRKYGPAVNLAVLQYLFFFQEHQALVDAVTIDPLNEQGLFWKIRDRMIENFLRRNELDKEVRYVRPVLIRDETPKEVFEALDILKQGFKASIEGYGIYYYSISLVVPTDKLSHWSNQILYLVCDTQKDAEEILKRLRKPKPSEVVKEDLPVGSNEERKVIDRERKKQGYDPFSSDASGDVLGDVEEGPRGLGNRRR
jgi:hypothetical protein